VFDNRTTAAEFDTVDLVEEDMVTPGRLELPTRSLGNCCSIHLSYGAIFHKTFILMHLYQDFVLILEARFRSVTDLVTSSSSRLAAAVLLFAALRVSETGTRRSTTARLCCGARCA
jgi:hypothetical protein